MLEIRTSSRNPSPKFEGDYSKSEPHQGNPKSISLKPQPKKADKNPSPNLEGDHSKSEPHQGREISLINQTESPISIEIIAIHEK